MLFVNIGAGNVQAAVLILNVSSSFFSYACSSTTTTKSFQKQTVTQHHLSWKKKDDNNVCDIRLVSNKYVYSINRHESTNKKNINY